MRLLFAQVLGALLEGILLETRFSLHKSLTDFFKLATVLVDLNLESLVIGLHLLVVITHLRVKFIEFSLISVVDILNLLLIAL